MAYTKRVKKAFKVGAKKGTTAKKRKQLKGGLKLAKKVDKGIGKFAQKGGAKMVKKGIKTKNKKMVNSVELFPLPCQNTSCMENQ